VDLLLVGKVTVCSLADEQTSVAERGMNGETEASERDIVSLKTLMDTNGLTRGRFFFT
jgi:hypothetical protein